MNKQSFAVTIVSLTLITTLSSCALSIEEPKYRVVQSSGSIEVREYESYLVAETIVRKKDLDESSTQGFRVLANYIFGNNTKKESISMTAPVTTERSEKIAMTAPVEMTAGVDEYVMTFMMPSTYTLNTLPEPNDSRVSIKEIPARRLAVIRFSGTWSEGNIEEHKLELFEWLKQHNLTQTGPPILARYDPPWIPWFLRRNEILIPIAN